jgi:hypothetical protein
MNAPQGVLPPPSDPLKRFLTNPLTAAAATGLGMITAGGGLARSGLMGPRVGAAASSPIGAAITLGAGTLGLGLTSLKFFDLMRDIMAKARTQTAETVAALGQRLSDKIKGAEAEPEKVASKKDDEDKETGFSKTIHHPLIQGAGYGSLAAEGVHALGERGMFGKKVQKWTHGTTGRRLGHAAIGGSAGFLGAEALAALSNMGR